MNFPCFSSAIFFSWWVRTVRTVWDYSPLPSGFGKPFVCFSFSSLPVGFGRRIKEPPFQTFRLSLLAHVLRPRQAGEEGGGRGGGGGGGGGGGRRGGEGFFHFMTLPFPTPSPSHALPPLLWRYFFTSTWCVPACNLSLLPMPSFIPSCSHEPTWYVTGYGDS